MDEQDAQELRQLAVRMHAMVRDVEEIGTCTEPTGDNDVCPRDCSDCGWFRNELRDSLLRLGVPI